MSFIQENPSLGNCYQLNSPHQTITESFQCPDHLVPTDIPQDTASTEHCNRCLVKRHEWHSPSEAAAMLVRMLLLLIPSDNAAFDRKPGVLTRKAGWKDSAQGGGTLRNFPVGVMHSCSLLGNWIIKEIPKLRLNGGWSSSSFLPHRYS